ncbi:MAG: YdeI/OmpD-associated family protein [Acidobacteriaceae bacterium]
MTPDKKAGKRFRGVLERDGTTLNWTIVKVPFDPAAEWPERKGLRVRGTINGFGFRTSLFRMKKGEFFLLVNKPMQKGGAVTLGSVAEVVLEPDLEARVAKTPPELEKLLRKDRGLRKWHEGLNESSRKWVGDWIGQPKSADSRVKRAEQMAERMLLAMEGERVTPPILEAAFRRLPKAREGWEGMTPLQRRQHLLGIFGYKSPESRQKRAQKAVEEALRIAGKGVPRASQWP